MRQYFEEVKQRYPKTAKALGITAGMDYEEWREAYHCKALRKMMKPRPVDTSGLNQPVPFPGSWYSHFTPQLQPIAKE